MEVPGGLYDRKQEMGFFSFLFFFSKPGYEIKVYSLLKDYYLSQWSYVLLRLGYEVRERPPFWMETTLILLWVRTANGKETDTLTIGSPNGGNGEYVSIGECDVGNHSRGHLSG